MYDEDRQTALAMYERMFEETADEQGLMQLLVSPTRQAVVLARSYDAKERKLQVQSQSREAGYTADVEDVPSFVFVIDKVAQQAEELGVKLPAVTEGQFSIFDEVEAELAEPAPQDAEPSAAEEAESGLEEAPAEKAAESAAEELELPLPVEAEDDAAAEASAALTEEEEPEDVSSSLEETAAAVDAFLADFSVENGELVSVKEKEEYKDSPTADSPAAQVEETEAAEDISDAQEAPVSPVEYRQKTNIFLLILYVFIAIPVGLAGIFILLLPTLIFLSLAAASAFVTISLISASFGSFAVIADTLVVFGAGLIGLALSILFLWLFIWFIGGVIYGFVRGLVRLGHKICCKEVAVQ